ncbi:MAG: DUF554 domain-containing protein [Tannerellaceae bacterium]|nr:DUF554 domain-containing protein [Tannerellaceae bacterium]
MTGTLANSGAIFVGGCIGLLIHSHLPEKMVKIIFQGIGLFTLVMGINMGLTAEHTILVLLSLISGSILGEAIDLDKQFRRFSEFVKQKTKRGNGEDATGDNRFTEGFVTASMLFCIGSLSILGAIEDGTGKTPHLLFTKSIMDGISSIALGSTFGIAIVFSSVPVLLYQGGITLSAAFFMQYMSESMIADMTATGGILLIGLSIRILEIKPLRVTNMLPSILIIVLLSYFFG